MLPARLSIAGVSNVDLAALVLRVSTGALFLAHAGLKLFVFTPAGTAGFFESLGFPRGMTIRDVVMLPTNFDL